MGIVSLKAGLTPVGAFLVGLEADLIGLRMTTVILSSMAGAIAVILLLTSSTVRECCLSQSIGD